MEAGNVPTQTKDCAALVRAFHLWPRLWSPDVGRPQSRTSSGGKPGCRVPGTAVRLRPREEGSVAEDGVSTCPGGWEGKKRTSRLCVSAWEREREAFSGIRAEAGSHLVPAAVGTPVQGEGEASPAGKD